MDTSNHFNHKGAAAQSKSLIVAMVKESSLCISVTSHSHAAAAASQEVVQILHDVKVHRPGNHT